MSPERYRKLQAVIDRRQPDLTVLMENIRKPHNLAAISRSADAVGVGEVHGVFPHAHLSINLHAASGTNRYMNVVKHNTLAEGYQKLREKGFKLLAANLDDSAVDYREWDYCQPTALVMGMELEGISEEAVANADQSVYIPMCGITQSLNVSVAAALLLFEAKRQREAAGLYDRCRIDAEQRRQTLFRWCHPKVTAYCDKHGLPYPAVDEDGFIAEPLADRLANEQTTLVKTLRERDLKI